MFYLSRFGVLFCSVVIGSDKRLLDRVVSCANILTAAVLECNIAHRRYIAVFCMLFKLGVTRRTLSICCFVSAVCDRAGYTRYFGGLVAHRYIYSPPRFRTSQNVQHY